MRIVRRIPVCPLLPPKKSDCIFFFSPCTCILFMYFFYIFTHTYIQAKQNYTRTALFFIMCPCNCAFCRSFQCFGLYHHSSGYPSFVSRNSPFPTAWVVTFVRVPALSSLRHVGGPLSTLSHPPSVNLYI